MDFLTYFLLVLLLFPPCVGLADISVYITPTDYFNALSPLFPKVVLWVEKIDLKNTNLKLYILYGKNA